MRHQLALGVILATILGACAGGGGTTAPTASPAGSPTATGVTPGPERAAIERDTSASDRPGNLDAALSRLRSSMFNASELEV